jgi:hypothetical protein
MNLTRVLHSPLLRKPLFVMVALEAILVLGLAAVAWHVWQSRQEPVGASAGTLPALGPPGVAPVPTQHPGPATISRASPSPKPAPPPAPGFRTDAEFFSRQFRDINRDQAALQDVEWRFVRAAIQGMKSYLERVVLPRVEHAEGRGR